MTPRLTAVLIEGRHSPRGIEGHPRIQWTLEAETDLTQESFRVVVSRDGRTIGDSGEQLGPHGSWVLEAHLESLTFYTVDVVVGTNRGETAGRTEFATGVLDAAAWSDAAWISAGNASGGPAPLLRRRLDVPDVRGRALLAIAVAGCASVRINGVELDEQLIGGITDFTVRVQYTVLDVTCLIRAGLNDLEVEVGNAFYGMSSPNTWNWETAPWHAVPSVKALFVTEGEGGVRDVTGTAWQAATGGTLDNDYFAGETYDARREPSWVPATVVTGPVGRLESARQPPIRVTEVVEFTAVSRVGTSWVVDFGKVIAGWVRLSVRCAPGQRLVLRYGERLRPDGLPDNDDPHGYFDGRFQQDVYVARGEGIEQWHPRFGWKGFRYVAIDGWSDTPPRPHEIVASRVHTSVERTGRFACSSDVLTGIHRITVETLLNNLHGIPTDTPMYEKNGWTGDGMLATEMILFNLDAHGLLDKWVDDIVDTARPDGTPSVIAPDGGWRFDWEPCPTWHSALVLIPWWLAWYSGDDRVLHRTYDAIRNYVTSEFERWPDRIATTTLGDWVSPETSPGGGNPHEDLRVAATAFLYAQCTTAAQIARAVGRDADARRFAEYARDVREAFLAAFFDTTRGIVGSDEDRGFRQAHQALAVGLGLLSGSDASRAVAALADDIRTRDLHLNTGILSTKYVLPVLSDHGYHDLAVAVAQQTSYPSWGFWLESGATTTWEHWHPESRSRNHYALGTVDEWLYTHVLGVTPVAAGFDRFTVRLRPTALIAHADGEIMTPRGPIRVSWRREADLLELELTVPVGSTALVEVDAEHVPSAVRGARREVGAGVHRLVWSGLSLGSS